MEPFSRYGIYIQELNHRYVFGTAETHFQTKPGIVGNAGGFSMISNLGTSSIPFIEYVTVGKGQVIPAGTSVSRHGKIFGEEFGINHLDQFSLMYHQYHPRLKIS